MNMPYLTVLRDSDGDGKADERKELFTDLGVPPTAQGLQRPHRLGHPVRHRRISLHLGRRQGRSQGDRPRRPDDPDQRRRDVPLPARRHRAGGLHHRHPQPPRAQPRRPRQPLHLRQHRRRPRLVDPRHAPHRRRLLRLSLRLSRPARPHARRGWPSTAAARLAAALVYKEDVWPEKYRSRSSGPSGAREKSAPSGSSPTARRSRSPSDRLRRAGRRSSDFRPIDLALSYDGRTLYVADWDMGGWGSKTEKVGRVYAITYKGDDRRPARAGKDSDPMEAQIKQLDHPSFNERMRARRP